MISTVYAVDGMNCANCAGKVSTAVAGLPQVAEAVVDLSAGKVTVTSERTLDTAVLAATLAAKGFTLRA